MSCLVVSAPDSVSFWKPLSISIFSPQSSVLSSQPVEPGSVSCHRAAAPATLPGKNFPAPMPSGGVDQVGLFPLNIVPQLNSSSVECKHIPVSACWLFVSFHPETYLTQSLSHLQLDQSALIGPVHLTQSLSHLQLDQSALIGPVHLTQSLSHLQLDQSALIGPVHLTQSLSHLQLDQSALIGPVHLTQSLSHLQLDQNAADWLLTFTLASFHWLC